MPDPVTQYLLSRGVTPSAENASRVRAAYASNPDLLDRRATGLPGGLDDNSAAIDAALDAVLAKSMPSAAPIPQGSAEVGTPEKAPPPSRTAPTVKGPGEVGGTKAVATGSPSTTASNKGNYDPGPSQNTVVAPNDGSVTSTGTSNVLTGPPVGSQVGDTQRSGITEWLLGLLGAGAGAYGLSKMGVGGTPAPTNAPLPGTVPPGAGGNAPPVTSRDVPAPYSTDMRTPAANNPVAGSPVVAAPGTADPDGYMRQRMEAEIAAENDAMQRQMEQEALRRKKQIETQETARAARRATGRR